MPLTSSTNTKTAQSNAGRPFLLGDNIVRRLDTANDAAYWGSSGVRADDAPGESTNLDPATTGDAGLPNSYWRILDGTGLGAFRPDLSGGAQSEVFLHVDLVDDANSADTVIVWYDVEDYNREFSISLRFRPTGTDTYYVIQTINIGIDEPRQGSVWATLPYVYGEIEGIRVEFDGPWDWDVGSTPGVRELYVGSRAQLSIGELRPADPAHQVSSVQDFFSDSGVHQRIVLYSGAMQRDLSFASYPAFGFDNTAIFRQLRLDLDGGTRPVWWVPEPSNRFQCYLGTIEGGAIEILEAGRVRHDVRIPFLEVAPFYRDRA